MEHFVVNIGRQLGSGGREIGERLAQRLNISFYDKELIQLALEGGGRDNVTAIVLQIREKAPIWRRLFGRGGGKEAEGS